MDAPNYVQGLYSVTDRDAIFTKANKYPDAANGLQNQVPTIFPDGSIGWRQIPEGGDGTANANIAVVESTQYASKDYGVGDLLIYNDQLCIVRRPISAGQQIDLLTDVRSTRVDSQLFPRIGKGINLFRNWYFRGGGSQQGGGQLPINQRGLTTYTGAGPTIDGWQQTGGTTTVDAYTVTHTSPAGSSSDFYQIVDVPINDGFYNIPIAFGIMRQSNYFRASAVVYGASEPVQVFDQPEFSLWLEALSDKRVKAIIRVYAGQSVSLQAAKLEIGTHGTLAELAYSGFQISDPPPDYGEELAKCQRYLLVLRPSTGNALIAHGYGQNSTHYRFSIPSPVTMLPPTSISKTGRVQILTNGTYTDISDIVLLWGSNGNSVNVEITLSEPLSAFELYGYAMLVLIGGSSIIISTEP